MAMIIMAVANIIFLLSIFIYRSYILYKHKYTLGESHSILSPTILVRPSLASTWLLMTTRIFISIMAMVMIMVMIMMILMMIMMTMIVMMMMMMKMMTTPMMMMMYKVMTHLQLLPSGEPRHYFSSFYETTKNLMKQTKFYKTN